LIKQKVFGKKPTMIKIDEDKLVNPQNMKVTGELTTSLQTCDPVFKQVITNML
jgi:hypothetical protein